MVCVAVTHTRSNASPTWYHVPAADKKEVWNWYTSPIRFHAMLVYFMVVWRQDIKSIRLRRFMHFSKSRICTSLKTVNPNSVEIQSLREQLMPHYQENTRRYRAGAMTKARTAIEHPDEAISIAIDGADQMEWLILKAQKEHTRAN